MCLVFTEKFSHSQSHYLCAHYLTAAVACQDLLRRTASSSTLAAASPTQPSNKELMLIVRNMHKTQLYDGEEQIFNGWALTSLYLCQFSFESSCSLDDGDQPVFLFKNMNGISVLNFSLFVLCP